jgi:outer membrane protein OmpA-like peptidoglycan-associated protein
MALSKNQKRFAIIGGIVIAVGIGIWLISRAVKSSKARKECEKKGGKYDKKTKSCKIDTPPILQDVIAKAYDNLTFVTNSATINPSSNPFLKEMADYLKANPTFTIKITGHTDNVGNDAYNLDLSKRRADSVKDALVNQGVGEIAITTDGKGETEPIADNNTAQGRSMNRRVVFEVTKVEEVAPATTQTT